MQDLAAGGIDGKMMSLGGCRVEEGEKVVRRMERREESHSCAPDSGGPIAPLLIMHLCHLTVRSRKA